MSTEPRVMKVGYTVPISTELAMEYGLIPDTRPPLTRRQRWSYRWRYDIRPWPRIQAANLLHRAGRAVHPYGYGCDERDYE